MTDALKGEDTEKFQSTLPTRGSDKPDYRISGIRGYFNPRSPRGGATIALRAGVMRPAISIHAPHEGERLHCIFPSVPKGVFQSTLPTRGSDDGVTLSFDDGSISIHAPHEGERLRYKVIAVSDSGISIHAPHEGERRVSVIPSAVAYIFQSTLPTRGSDTL